MFNKLLIFFSVVFLSSFVPVSAGLLSGNEIEVTWQYTPNGATSPVASGELFGEDIDADGFLSLSEIKTISDSNYTVASNELTIATLTHIGTISIIDSSWSNDVENRDDVELYDTWYKWSPGNGSSIFAVSETYSNLNYTFNVSSEYQASPVPVPAAIWLFGSGLIGLIGARKKALKLPELSV